MFQGVAFYSTKLEQSGIFKGKQKISVKHLDWGWLDDAPVDIESIERASQTAACMNQTKNGGWEGVGGTMTGAC